MMNMAMCMLRACGNPACCPTDIVEIKHILLPADEKRFKDIFVVFELMETDLHQVCSCCSLPLPCDCT